MLVDPANTMTELLRFGVNLTQKAADRLVEGRKREEAAVPQPRQNPATNDLYPHLNFGFVLWMIWACWRYGGAVMTGEIRVGAVDHRFVEARPRDAGLENILSAPFASKAALISVDRRWAVNQRSQGDQAVAAKLIRALPVGRAAGDIILHP